MRAKAIGLPSNAMAKSKSISLSGRRNRAQSELIRKRRNNLFKRLTEFKTRYNIDIWLSMQMSNGRLYTFDTEPAQALPSEDEYVSKGVPNHRPNTNRLSREQVVCQLFANALLTMSKSTPRVNTGTVGIPVPFSSMDLTRYIMPILLRRERGLKE